MSIITGFFNPSIESDAFNFEARSKGLVYSGANRGSQNGASVSSLNSQTFFNANNPAPFDCFIQVITNIFVYLDAATTIDGDGENAEKTIGAYLGGVSTNLQNTLLNGIQGSAGIGVSKRFDNTPAGGSPIAQDVLQTGVVPSNGQRVVGYYGMISFYVNQGQTASLDIVGNSLILSVTGAATTVVQHNFMVRQL